jgi:hypothetical protein
MKSQEVILDIIAGSLASLAVIEDRRLEVEKGIMITIEKVVAVLDKLDAVKSDDASKDAKIADLEKQVADLTAQVASAPQGITNPDVEARIDAEIAPVAPAVAPAA